MEYTYLNYKTTELTESQIFTPSKELIVWKDVLKPEIKNVVCIVKCKDGIHVITEEGECWPHCAKIPEELKPRTIATNRELAEWCAKGNGQIHYVGAANVHTFYSYHNEDDNSLVTKDIRVRRFGDEDWHEPTLDYLGISLEFLIPKLNKSEDSSGKVTDNIVEKMIQIGNQKWMAKNLNLTDEELGIDHWKNPYNGEIYYTWEAANRIAKKVEGFHLPTDEEWDKACEDSQLKEKLELKLAGGCNGSFCFYSVGSSGYFWSASELSSSLALYRYFDTGSSVIRNNSDKTRGYSVRLIKDKE